MPNTLTPCPAGGDHTLSPVDAAPGGGTIHECTAPGCGHVEHQAADGTRRPVPTPRPARSPDWWDGVRATLRRSTTWRSGMQWVRLDDVEMPLDDAIAVINGEQAAELVTASIAVAAAHDDPPPWTGFEVNLTPPADEAEAVEGVA